jgi:3-hydroxy-9,10-secoandrosta-1,3,5(10)-triene-9,17-dione monooxygenase
VRKKSRFRENRHETGSGPEFDEGGPVVDAAELLVPARDIVIRDDWNVVALRGTGSCSIVANDVFVPKHRYLSLPGIIAGEAPGAAAHDTSLY